MTDSEIHIRTFLKIIRDKNKTAYDELPSGKTLGEVANEAAIYRYSRKIKLKRERARETRSLKKIKKVDDLKEEEKKEIKGK